MKRKWSDARKRAYLETDHAQAFAKCGGVTSGNGPQMAICVRNVKDYTQQLRKLGYANMKINKMVEHKILDEFVVERREKMLRRADKLQKQAEQLRKLAFTVRVRKSKTQSTRSPSKRRLRFGFYSVK